MFPSNPKNLTTTLFLYVTIAIVLAGTVNADVHHRDHANVNRMLKKRQSEAPKPTEPLVNVVGLPSLTSASSILSSTVSPSASASVSASASASESASASASIESVSESLSSVSSTVSSVEPVTSSAAPSVSSTAPEVISTPAPSPTPEPGLNLTGVPAASKSKDAVVINVTQTQQLPVQSSTSDENNNKGPSTALNSTGGKVTIILVVIAACLGGAAIIWTIIRKWKLKPSAQFDDRMQPIDWQPTNDDSASGHGLHRTNSTASSFVSSASHGQGLAGRGAGGGAGGYGATTNSHDPLDHDFTAAPLNPHLAPVGGYADLARGPSPGPQMQELRSASPAHPSYDQYAPQQAAYPDFNSQPRY